MDNITRIPRPLGATSLARTFREERTKDNRKKLNNLYIQAFVNQAYYVNPTIITHLYSNPAPNTKTNKGTKQGKTKKITRTYYHNNTQGVQYIGEEIRVGSISELSAFLGLSEERARKRIMVFLRKQAEASGAEELEQNAQHTMARAAIWGTFFGALQQGLIQQEWGTELRAVARANGYQALMVKEANSAMGNQISQTKQIWDMARQLVGTQGTGPSTQINITQTNQPTTNQQFLTPTMAVKLIEEKGYNEMPLPGSALLQELSIQHDIANMPDVLALPSDAQGVATSKAKDLIYINHETRREEELGVISHEIS